MPATTSRDRVRSPDDLPQALARNSLLNLMGLGLPLVVAVVAIPPILDGLGSARFGILGMVWVAIAYLNLLDLGLGRATTRFAAAAIADGASDRLRAIIGTAAISQLGLGLVAGGIGAVVAAPLLTRFLDVSPALQQETLWSFVVLAAAAPIMTITNSFRGVLEAGQQFALINLVRVPVSMANFLVPLMGVQLDWSLPGMVGWLVVVRAAALLAYAAACLRRWPELRRPLGLKADRLRELLGFGGWVTVSAVVSSLLVYADRFIVGGVASVEAAGFYTVPHEMVTRLDILPSALVMTLFPALSAMADRPDRGSTAELIQSSIVYLLAAVGPLLIALAVMSGDVLSVWIGPAFADRAEGALRVLALGMIANAVAFVPYSALQAAGRPDVTAKFHLLELPVHLVLVWWLVGQWGILGAAVAWSLRTVLDAALLLGAASVLGLSPMREWRLGRLPRVLGMLVVFALLLLGAAAGITEPVPALVAAGILLLLWALWAWRGMLRPGERARLLAAAGLRR